MVEKYYDKVVMLLQEAQGELEESEFQELLNAIKRDIEIFEDSDDV